MILILGLGNTGRQYQGTRHNLGFAILDALADTQGASWRQAAGGEVLIAELDSPQRTVLAKPQTFMNLSGTPTAALIKKYHLSPDQVWVVHDELDLPLGRLQFKIGGGTAGHNGLESIVQQVGSSDFVRLRIGIGPTVKPPQFDGADFVLGRLTSAEQTALPTILEDATKALLHALELGVPATMNVLHQKKSPGAPARGDE